MNKLLLTLAIVAVNCLAANGADLPRKGHGVNAFRADLKLTPVHGVLFEELNSNQTNPMNENYVACRIVPTGEKEPIDAWLELKPKKKEKEKAKKASPCPSTGESRCCCSTKIVQVEPARTPLVEDVGSPRYTVNIVNNLTSDNRQTVIQEAPVQAATCPNCGLRTHAYGDNIWCPTRYNYYRYRYHYRY